MAEMPHVRFRMPSDLLAELVALVAERQELSPHREVTRSELIREAIEGLLAKRRDEQ